MGRWRGGTQLVYNHEFIESRSSLEKQKNSLVRWKKSHKELVNRDVHWQASPVGVRRKKEEKEFACVT